MTRKVLEDPQEFFIKKMGDQGIGSSRSFVAIRNFLPNSRTFGEHVSWLD